MATGTGLPIQKSQTVLTQPAGVIDGDKYSSAQAWGKIAAAGAQLANTGEGLLKKELHQQQAKAIADFEVENSNTYINLRDQFQHNPKGFEEAAQAHNEGALSQVPGWMAPHAKAYLGGKLNGTLATVLSETRSRDEKLAAQSVDARRQSADNEVMAIAMAGKVSDPNFAAAMATYQAVLDSAVSTGLLAPEKAALLNDDLTGRAWGAVAAKSAVDIYRDSSVDENGKPIGGYNAAVDHLKKNILENENLTMKPSAKRAAFDQGMKELNLNKRLDNEDRAVFVREAQETIKQLQANIPVDRGVLDDQLKALARTGAWSTHRSLFVESKTAEFTAAYRSGAVTPSDQARVVGGLRADVMQNQAMQYFIGKGYDPHKAAGIVANLVSEGGPGLNPNARNRGDGSDGSDSIGIGQWNGPRAVALKAFAASQGKPWNDLQVQLDFIDLELKGSEGKAGAMLHAARTPEEAARAVLHYERPKDFETGHGYRLARAKQIHDRFAKGTLGDGSEIPGLTGVPYAGYIAKRVQGEFVQQMKKDWPEFSKQIAEGKPLNSEDFDAIRTAAALSGDAHWQKQVEDAGIALNVTRGIRDMPAAQRQAVLDQAREKFDDNIYKIINQQFERQNKMLADDPVGWAMESGRGAPMPLNVADSASFRAGLGERAKIAASVASDQRVPVASAVRPSEIQSIQAALAAADLPGKARIYSDITAALPEDQRAIVLGKLGSKGGTAMVEAFAGAMYQQAPDIGESIMRGQRAIATDKRFDPSTGSNKQTFNDVLDKKLPGTAFSLAIRTSDKGAWATFRSAVIARYADLSAQAGDTSSVNESRIKQAVDDVTGGVLQHNGGSFIAPRRGMSQSQFDGVMWGLKDTDLEGVTTLAGEPITAEYLRRNSKLESIGDGRYLVQLGSDPLKPIYAFTGAAYEGQPQPYILDLRNRQAAPRPPVQGVKFEPYPRG